MQLYRGMDIGTAKITKDEQKNVPHHLLDIWDVTKTASVAEYRRLADITIEDITSRGKLPILVGGSGLYIRAALGELDFPGTDSEVRARLERELKETGPGPLHERLQEQDPRAAEQILPSNGRRIVRALEVIEISGASFSAKMPKYGGGRPALQVGLAMPRPELDQRVAERVDRMWAAGLVEEVKKLEQSGLRDGLTASRALGYAQVLRFLEGQCTEPEAKNETVKATRRFVRRQESWFRRDPRVAWADDAGSARELVRRSVA
jgi:tRNA dimethylallyltransferase